MWPKAGGIDAAIEWAGKDWRQYLEREGGRRIEHAKKMLGIKA